MPYQRDQRLLATEEAVPGSTAGSGKMSDVSQRTFRAVALQRAASPEQLDHLVRITKPLDWIIIFVICIALIAAVTWGIVGRVPTRAAGEGILISGGGRVVEAASAAAGRLATISVMVGDHVIKGQPIAEIVQTDIQQKHASRRRGVPRKGAPAQRPDRKDRA